MTNKIQKIREEVERLKSQLLRGACSSQIAMETGCKEEAYNEVLAILDSLQEKSVKEDLEDFALQYAGHHAPYDSCMQEVEDAVKAGAKWWKEQMIEKADLKEKKDVYPQWKPSKIQMSALKVASGLANIDMQAILYSLYNDLKKL